MNLIGERFGRWYVKSVGEPYIFPNSNRKATRYTCECDCGNVKIVRESSLLNGDSTSCGCYAREVAAVRAKTHGLSQHPLTQRHFDMIRRCYDESRKDYKHYGGRGIAVCERWKDVEKGLENFIEDMYPSFVEGMELDRINVNGDYVKENCRWVDRRIQVINRRPTGKNFDAHFVEFGGKTLCLSQWEVVSGINKHILSDRLTKLKWSVEKALTTTVKVKQYFVVVKDTKLRIEDVFKHVPNLYYYAKRNNTTFQELLSGLFYNKFLIVGIVNKLEVEFKPTKDFSHLLNMGWLKEGFKLNAEEFFSYYGVKL